MFIDLNTLWSALFKKPVIFSEEDSKKIVEIYNKYSGENLTDVGHVPAVESAEFLLREISRLEDLVEPSNRIFLKKYINELKS